MDIKTCKLVTTDEYWIKVGFALVFIYAIINVLIVVRRMTP